MNKIKPYRGKYPNGHYAKNRLNPDSYYRRHRKLKKYTPPTYELLIQSPAYQSLDRHEQIKLIIINGHSHHLTKEESDNFHRQIFNIIKMSFAGINREIVP